MIYLKQFLFLVGVAPKILNATQWQDWHESDKLCLEDKEIKHMKVCVTKLGKKIGLPIISIGNGWNEFKTTNELKVRDHVVFTLNVVSTSKV
jgi:hypothetical protein